MMVNNAKTYNVEGSEVYDDAQTIGKILLKGKKLVNPYAAPSASSSSLPLLRTPSV